MSKLSKTAKVAEVAGYFALGPITGPLTAGMVYNLRKGRRIVAGIYALGIAATFVLLPVILASTLAWYAGILAAHG